MFKYIILAALVGVALARPQGNAPEVSIVRSENENEGDGTFKWLFELDDGTYHEQSGYAKPSDDPENPIIQVIQGTFTYYADDGTPITLNYVADENGFQPEGEHLPTPPPIPAEIQKLIDMINAKK